MKNIYEAPEIRVVTLDQKDILTTSTNGSGNAVLPDDEF